MTDLRAPVEANGHGPMSMLAYAAELAQPRRRAVTVRKAAGGWVRRVWAAVAPHLLTAAAVCCAAAAAYTWALWAGLLATGAGLWLIELHVALEGRPAGPPGGGK